MTVSLDFLPQTAFAFLLVFARLGAMTMSLPGFGHRAVPQRIRLILALGLALIFYPLLQGTLPPMPGNLRTLLLLLGGEVLLGLALGFGVRLIMTALTFAGSVIAFQMGLSFAQTVDPGEGTQGLIIGTFLSLLATVLIFAADLHHLLLAAMYDSYRLFRPGDWIPLGDFAAQAVTLLGGAFRVALQLAAPFLVFGLIFYLGVGILARLIPQIQIFFVAMPANILLGIVLFLLLLSTLMMWYLRYFGDTLRAVFLSP